jgi:hypothetical protein
MAEIAGQAGGAGWTRTTYLRSNESLNAAPNVHRLALFDFLAVGVRLIQEAQLQLIRPRKTRWEVFHPRKREDHEAGACRPHLTIG